MLLTILILLLIYFFTLLYILESNIFAEDNSANYTVVHHKAIYILTLNTSNPSLNHSLALSEDVRQRMEWMYR